MRRRLLPALVIKRCCIPHAMIRPGPLHSLLSAAREAVRPRPPVVGLQWFWLALLVVGRSALSVKRARCIRTARPRSRLGNLENSVPRGRGNRPGPGGPRPRRGARAGAAPARSKYVARYIARPPYPRRRTARSATRAARSGGSGRAPRHRGVRPGRSRRAVEPRPLARASCGRSRSPEPGRRARRAARGAHGHGARRHATYRTIQRHRQRASPMPRARARRDMFDVT